MRPISYAAQTGLFCGGIMAPAFALNGQFAGLAATAAVMACSWAALAYQQLQQLRQDRTPAGDLPLSRPPVAETAIDQNIQGHLKRELADRYPIFAEERFISIRDKVVSNIVDALNQSRKGSDPRDAKPRGYVTETAIEAQVAKLKEHLKAGTGVQQALREGLENDRGRLAQRWRMEESAASALKKAYPTLEADENAKIAGGLVKKVIEEWTRLGSPILMGHPRIASPLIDEIVHSQVKGFIDFLSKKDLNPEHKQLLAGLRRDVRARDLAPWKALLLPHALIVGMSLVGGTGVSSMIDPSAGRAVATVGPTEDCRGSFAADRFASKPDKSLPMPSRLSFVPAWMKNDEKARQAWILTRFIPAYLEHFECRWTERLDLEQGLRWMNEVLDAWKGQESFEIPARIEGEPSGDKPSVVTISSEIFRQALEDKILKKYPELSMHRTVLEARKKDAKRGVRGEDIPQVGRTIDYEGYAYAHLGARIVRWPQGSQKIALEKELWDAAKGEWVKCLPKEMK